MLCTGVRARRGFALGGVFGIAFFGLLLYWISIVGWAAWIVLVVVETMFIALFGATWAVASRRNSLAVRLLAPPVLWVAFEYLRSRVPVGGFTWGQLAQSQHNVSWLLRFAGVAGGWGIAFVLVACNAALAVGLAEVGRRRWGRAVSLTVASAALIALPGLTPAAHATGAPLKVAIVQGNVPEHFAGSVVGEQLQILRSHLALTRSIVAEHPDLVVWPESSVGFDPFRYAVARTAIARAARAVDAPMIVGGNEDIDSAHYRVVAWFVSPTGSIEDTYVKTHLVPFGEYVPGRRFLSWLPLLAQIPQDAVAAHDPKNFSVDGDQVSTVISYEGDFGSLVRQRIDLGGRLLVVATNTSTWRRSWASAQHVAMSQVRAAENGVWVVHAALSGISAFVDPAGRVVSSTPLWTAAALVHTVRFARSVTLYARMGDWLPFSCMALGVLVVVFGARKRREASA
jgi:apolipoprotein N-acyltransferase